MADTTAEATPVPADSRPAHPPKKADLRKLLGVMRRIGASDLHLKEGQRPLYRIHGELREADHPPLTREEMEGFVEEAVPKHLRQHFDDAGQADFAMSIDVLTRFRVNCYRSTHKLAFAFRLLELEANVHCPQYKLNHSGFDVFCSVL